jgi:hypothetical protein
MSSTKKPWAWCRRVSMIAGGLLAAGAATVALAVASPLSAVPRPVLSTFPRLASARTGSAQAGAARQSKTHSSGDVPLESLPAPRFSSCIGNCRGRLVRIHSALIGTTLYHRGFQLITTVGGVTGPTGPEGFSVTYTWRIKPQYSSFSGGFALGAGDECGAVVVEISGKPPVNIYGISPSSAHFIHAKVTSQSSMSIRLIMECPNGKSVVDVVDDELS